MFFTNSCGFTLATSIFLPRTGKILSVPESNMKFLLQTIKNFIFWKDSSTSKMACLLMMIYYRWITLRSIGTLNSIAFIGFADDKSWTRFHMKGSYVPALAVIALDNGF